MDTKKVKIGDYLSETQYYKVMGIGLNHIEVVNDRDFKFSISSDIVKEGCISADQYTEEKKLTMTEMAELFASIGDSVFTVNFNKQVKEKDVRDALSDLYANKGGVLLSKTEYAKKVKEALKGVYEGEERILTGYKIGSDRVLGRSTVIDMTKERGTGSYDGRIRQVDHRHINWLVYKGVKYITK